MISFFSSRRLTNVSADFIRARSNSSASDLARPCTAVPRPQTFCGKIILWKEKNHETKKINRTSLDFFIIVLWFLWPKCNSWDDISIFSFFENMKDRNGSFIIRAVRYLKLKERDIWKLPPSPLMVPIAMDTERITDKKTHHQKCSMLIINVKRTICKN